MIGIDEILAFDCSVFLVGAAPIEISPALEALPESWPLIGGELSFNGGMPSEIAFLGEKSRFNKSKIDCGNY